jgi:diketogulonate reductase-like aldo/keto reductase
MASLAGGEGDDEGFSAITTPGSAPGTPGPPDMTGAPGHGGGTMRSLSPGPTGLPGVFPPGTPGHRGGIMRSLSPVSDMRKQCSAAGLSEKAAIALKLRLDRTISLNDGYRMPAMGFGTFSNTDAPAEMGNACYAALEAGFRALDCAEAYKNEGAVGDALHRALKDGLCTRDEVFITSKVWQTNHEAKRVREACLHTLENLGVTYVDMYLVHWPLAWEYTNVECDPLVPTDESGRVLMSTSGCSIHETWRAMEALVDDGLAKSIGVSNFSSVQLADLMTYARILPAVNQVECHPMLQQHNLREMCAHNNICVISYAPLGRPGNLSENDPVLMQHETVVQIAKARGISAAQVLLQWQMLHGLATVPKSTNVSHMRDNLNCMDQRISVDEVAALDRIGEVHRFCNKRWCAGVNVFD